MASADRSKDDPRGKSEDTSNFFEARAVEIPDTARVIRVRRGKIIQNSDVAEVDEGTPSERTAYGQSISIQQVPTKRRLHRVATDASKRAMDISGALLGLLFFLPLMLLVALAIKADSRGPIIFKQRRTGLNGSIFNIYKFRTMHVTEDGRDIRHASKDDARVTRVGKFLRTTSLDELPQLLNVLFGNMSLIGPRPHALAHDKYYGELLPGYRSRFRTRPGITGLAQIQGKRGEIHTLSCMKKRVEADCLYIDQWSLLLDFAIIMRTIPLLVKDEAAY